MSRVLLLLVSLYSASAAPRARIDLADSSEEALNAHINVEYAAHYQYQAMWAYFDRDDVALPGVAKFFKSMAEEEQSHAHEFQAYLNMRGGRVRLTELMPPVHDFSETDTQSDALVAFTKALELEKSVYQNLLQVHAMAGKNNDPNMEDKIEHYLDEQVESIKSFATRVAQLTRIGKDGTGVFIFDHELE